MRRGDRRKFYNRPMQNSTFCNRIIRCDRSLEVVNLHARDQADGPGIASCCSAAAGSPECEIQFAKVLVGAPMAAVKQ